MLVVDWEAVHDQVATFGALITEYHVYIREADGTSYSAVSEDCPPTDVDLIQNTQCTVQISTLRAEPFLLQHEAAIYAKVVQVNSIGASQMSDAGTGASVFVPVVPDAPVTLLPVLSEISLTQVSFTWSDGAYNGGKPILDYQVSYD